MDHKFAPCLWVNGHVEEMANFYLDIFAVSKHNSTSYFIDDLHGIKGDILTISLTLDNQEFILLNGGDDFSMTPAISYVVTCTSEKELKHLWTELSRDGQILMPLDTYEEYGLFGWTNDRFGTSWQVILGENSEQTITPCFMFANEKYGQAAVAMKEWLDIFGHGLILSTKENNDGTIKIAEFSMYEQHFLVMDSPLEHHFTFTMGNSFYIYCENQAEIDRLWAEMTAKGKEWPCGWMEDQFGVAWQTVTEDMEMLFNPDYPNKANKVMQALYQMNKIDIDVLRKIYQETTE